MDEQIKVIADREASTGDDVSTASRGYARLNREQDQIQEHKAVLSIEDSDDEDFAPVRKKLALLEKDLNRVTKATPTTAISAPGSPDRSRKSSRKG